MSSDCLVITHPIRPRLRVEKNKIKKIIKTGKLGKESLDYFYKSSMQLPWYLEDGGSEIGTYVCNQRPQGPTSPMEFKLMLWIVHLFKSHIDGISVAIGSKAMKWTSIFCYVSWSWIRCLATSVVLDFWQMHNPVPPIGICRVSGLTKMQDAMYSLFYCHFHLHPALSGDEPRRKM